MLETCPDCGSEIEIIHTIGAMADSEPNVSLVNELLDSTVYNVPFRCLRCDAIKFSYRAIFDHVFIYPTPIPDLYADSHLIIPDTYKRHYRNWIGVVLHIGPGLQLQSGAYKHTQLKVGQRVVYDKTVPWSVDVEDTYGELQKVMICGELDVRAILGEGDELKE